MAKYHIFKKPSQISEAIRRAKRSGDNIAVSKLNKFKDNKFVRTKSVSVYY